MKNLRTEKREDKDRMNRVAQRREEWFEGLDNLSEEQIQQLSAKWHALINRYTVFIGKIKVREMNKENAICN